MEGEKIFYTKDEIFKLCEGLPARDRYRKASEIIWNGRGAAIWNAEIGVLAAPYVLVFLGTPTPIAVELWTPSRSTFGGYVVGPAKLNPSAPSSIESVVFKAKLTSVYGRLVTSFGEFDVNSPFGKYALREAVDKLEEPYRSRLLAFLIADEKTSQERWVVFRKGVFSGDYQNEDEARIAACADRIRRRKSYRFWKDWIEFLGRGPSEAEILERIHRSIDRMSGYRSHGNSHCYGESLKLALKDARKEVI